ncbi:Zn-dependent hydrolase [Leisingera thetidis]|uniref:Zn-dependent hydrolase n=1 Tax=Leisingera thetidis TaxID=2930199 RepID=UPI0021F7638B|nr:Zn-dependent hydrolase [Leisingera thetidis]
MAGYSVDGTRLWSRLMDMAEIGATVNGGSHRLALSQDDEDGRELFLAWCANRGFTAVFDKIGNLFVRRAGRTPAAPAVAIGSHLDTQPMGGRFDGVLGVLAGLEVLETLEDLGVATEAPVEVAVWTNEEGARFQPAMMGSGVHCGLHPLAEALAVADASGIPVAQELERFGYDRGVEPGSHAIGSYLELHIEQGPILEQEGKSIGVVTGGQAIRWYSLDLRGDETHAGPMPMAMRRDPVRHLAAAAELVYRTGTADADARATIGRIETRPGSINAVPGELHLSVDLRHPDESVLEQMHGSLAEGIAQLNDAAEGVEISLEQIWHSPVVHFDAQLAAAVRSSAAARGYAARDMVSGAGHDAFHLAKAVPAAMIFVPCRGGISHNAQEFTAPEQAAAGANVLLDVALQLAGAPVPPGTKA